MVKNFIRWSQGKFTQSELCFVGEISFRDKKIKQENVNISSKLYIENLILKRDKKNLETRLVLSK